MKPTIPIKQLLNPQIGKKGYFPIDLSTDNRYWNHHDISDITVFEKYLEQQRIHNNGFVAYGGYLEQRALYRSNSRFQSGITRDIHLGIDLWAPAGTSVHAFMDGTIHSFANNDDAGNYGPTLILEHDYNGAKLYSLYGHLSVSDMADWSVGLRFRESAIIATLGTPQENGGYAPHLHFQLMTTMNDYQGDFPGVAAQHELEFYKNIVVNPMPLVFK